MGYQRMTQAEWADLIAKNGYENAVQIARDFGTVIDETGAAPTAVNPSLAARPMVTGAPAYAKVPPEQGTKPMDTPAGGLNAANAEQPQDDEYAVLAREYAALPEQRAALRKQQFESGQQRLNEMYAGPSTSSQLFALSRALLAPRRFKGFAGTMQNVSQALGQIGEQRETAAQRRAEALARLQESYQTGQFEDREAALAGRLKLLEAQKPGRGTWSEDMRQFVSPDMPVPTDRKGVVNGKQVVQYTDGSYRTTNPDGSQSIYAPDGRFVRSVSAGAQ